MKRRFINLLICFISFFFIGEGKTISLIGNIIHIQIHVNHYQICETEIPDQHNSGRYDDDDKLMNSNIFELSGSFKMVLSFNYYLNIRSEDYTGKVWQPPKPV